MNDFQKTAFDFVKSLTNLLITLSTSALVFSAAMIDKIEVFKDNPMNYLFISWIFFTLSILFGVICFMGLSGNLDPLNGQPKPTINTPQVRVSSGLQIVSFIISIVFLILFSVLDKQALPPSLNVAYFAVSSAPP